MLAGSVNDEKGEGKKRHVKEEADIRPDSWITQLRGENRTRTVCLLVVSMNILFGVTLQGDARVETRIDKCFVKLGRITGNSKRLLNRYRVKNPPVDPRQEKIARENIW